MKHKRGISHPSFLQQDYNIKKSDAEWCSHVIRLAGVITKDEFGELVWEHRDANKIPFKRRHFLRQYGLMRGRRATIAFNAVYMFVYGQGLWQFEPFREIRTDFMPPEFQTEWWRDLKIPLIPWGQTPNGADQ
jgi:hypothetical protein